MFNEKVKCGISKHSNQLNSVSKEDEIGEDLHISSKRDLIFKIHVWNFKTDNVNSPEAMGVHDTFGEIAFSFEERQVKRDRQG